MSDNVTQDVNLLEDKATSETVVTKRLISDENYESLRDVQQSIFEATDVSPAIRKLVNRLIKQSDLQQLKEEMISNFNG